MRSLFATSFSILFAALLPIHCQASPQDGEFGGLALLGALQYAGSTADIDPGTPGMAFSPRAGTPPYPLPGDVNAIFVEDIRYGTDPLNKFDLFMPESATPTPAVIYIHGGGFRGLDKNRPYQFGFTRAVIDELLRNDIAFLSINYRLLENSNETVGVRKSLYDSRYALQFIRYYAARMNIDPERIALWGSSAGAGTCLWLALNNDMADPTAADSIRRMSTRVRGVAATIPQTTYDLNRWESDVLSDYGWQMNTAFALDPGLEGRMLDFYGIRSRAEYNTTEIDDYRAEVDMLAQVTPDDPELWLKNTNYAVSDPGIDDDHILHHPHFVRELVNAARSQGVPTIYEWGNTAPTNKSAFRENTQSYLIRKVTE